MTTDGMPLPRNGVSSIGGTEDKAEDDRDGGSVAQVGCTSLARLLLDSAADDGDAIAECG